MEYTFVTFKFNGVSISIDSVKERRCTAVCCNLLQKLEDKHYKEDLDNVNTIHLITNTTYPKNRIKELSKIRTTVSDADLLVTSDFQSKLMYGTVLLTSTSTCVVLDGFSMECVIQYLQKFDSSSASSILGQYAGTHVAPKQSKNRDFIRQTLINGIAHKRELYKGTVTVIPNWLSDKLPLLLKTDMQFIYDSELDEFISEDLDVFTEDALDGLCNLILSDDPATYNVGMRLLASYNYHKTPMATKLLLWKTRSRWLNAPRLPSAFAHVCNLIDPNNKIKNADIETAIGDTYAASECEQDKSLCMYLIKSELNNKVDDFVTKQMSKFSKFGIKFSFNID